MTETPNAVSAPRMGRPPLAKDPFDTKITSVRLTAITRARIETLVGPNRMAEFIRDAVDAELLRREREEKRKTLGVKGQDAS